MRIIQINKVYPNCKRGKQDLCRILGSGDYRKRNKCLAISIPFGNIFRYSDALQRPFSRSLVFSIAAIAEFKSVISNEGRSWIASKCKPRLASAIFNFFFLRKRTDFRYVFIYHIIFCISRNVVQMLTHFSIQIFADYTDNNCFLLMLRKRYLFSILFSKKEKLANRIRRAFKVLRVSTKIVGISNFRFYENAHEDYDEPCCFAALIELGVWEKWGNSPISANDFLSVLQVDARHVLKLL